MTGNASNRASVPETIFPKQRLYVFCKHPFTRLTIYVREWKCFSFWRSSRNPGTDQISCSHLALIEFRHTFPSLRTGARGWNQSRDRRPYNNMLCLMTSQGKSAGRDVDNAKPEYQE